MGTRVKEPKFYIFGFSHPAATVAACFETANSFPGAKRLAKALGNRLGMQRTVITNDRKKTLSILDWPMAAPHHIESCLPTGVSMLDLKYSKEKGWYGDGF